MEQEVDDNVGGCPLETPTSSSLLPDDLVVEFLLRLPVKNLHQCNCVSKAWRSLIRSSEFVHAYKNRHPDVGLLVANRGALDRDGTPTANHFYYSTLCYHHPPQFVSRFQVPCPGYDCDGVTEVIDGLVCFYSRNSLFVCNIFTNEVKPLPYCNNAMKYFFGFDVVNGVYKLLGCNWHSVQILTLGIGTDCYWRVIDFEFGPKRTFLEVKSIPDARSFCCDGVLYWVVVKGISRRKTRCFLVSFDLNEEKFHYIKVPRGMTSQCLLSHCFVKFMGKLALSTPTCMGGYKLSIHVLEDAMNSIWTKHSILLPEEFIQGYGSFSQWYGSFSDTRIPAGNLPDGQMLLVNQHFGDKFTTPIYSYDHQTCKFERLLVGKFPRLNLWELLDSSANFTCVPENLAALDILFGGAKPT